MSELVKQLVEDVNDLYNDIYPIVIFRNERSCEWNYHPMLRYITIMDKDELCELISEESENGIFYGYEKYLQGQLLIMSPLELLKKIDGIVLEGHGDMCYGEITISVYYGKREYETIMKLKGNECLRVGNDNMMKIAKYNMKNGGYYEDYI